MSEEKQPISQKKRAIILGILCVIVSLVLVMLIIYVDKRDKLREVAREPEPVSQQTKDTEGDTSGDTSQETEESEQKEELPKAVYGDWDLSKIDATIIPYGNNRDQQNDDGSPQGVTYYEGLYGKYQMECIGDKTLGKSIYLTFDCNVDNIETELVLDTLKEKSIKATFFVTGEFLDARPELVQRMIDEGHRVGARTKTFASIEKITEEKKLEEEISYVQEKLKEDFDYDCRLFQFTLGSFSEKALAMVDNLGMKSVFWSYLDYVTTDDPEKESLENAIKYLHPAAIYLMHAGNATNEKILSDFIDGVLKEGYSFAGVYPVDKETK